uniref:ATP-dependent RNA helicase Ski2/MTR4 C-terminal domain-containing protein n=1 Tax=Chloropicon laureae TaxID=464258 RepID=A0A7S3DYQ9_9CHLO
MEKSIGNIAGMEHKPTPAIIPVSGACVAEISSLRVGLPRNLKGPDGQRKVQMTISSVVKKYGANNLPLLHPSRDMNLEDLDECWFEINSLKPKFSGSARDASRVGTAKGLLKKVGHWDCRGIQRAMEIEAKVAEIEAKIKDSQVTVFDREIKLRSEVLKELGHIDATSVLQLKGRAACEIDTADELMASELMLEGAFNTLDVHQVVAVASCLVPVENTQAVVDVQPALKEPLLALKAAAQRIGDVSKAKGLEIDVEEYVQSFKSTLMNVSYSWSRGSSFSEISAMTDLFEGSIIRAMRRLNELIMQLHAASVAIGDEKLAEKFQKAAQSIQRGIIFAASLYVES